MTTTSADVVTYESTENIAHITINRPDRLNALNSDVIAGLRGAWERFNASSDRVAILQGAGDRAFSVGADLNDFSVELFPGIPNLGIKVDKPIIGVVQGHCIGGGIVLLANCEDRKSVV